nr:CRISPR-associated helicase Cas3' [Thiohalobacter thiocyanaticus]
MQKTYPNYYKYWGKSGEGGLCHLLPYHCLDVAAVGDVYLARNEYVRRQLAQMLGLDEEDFVSFVVFFLGLHDIGKFARHFQALQPELFNKLQGEQAELPYVRHDVLGELLWRTTLYPYGAERGLLSLTAGGRRPSYDTAADYWLHTVLGHHGKPVSAKDASVREVPESYFPETAREAAKDFFDDWRELRGLGADTPLPPAETVAKASWWLAGLAVLCDWLGSNQRYFPLVEEVIPLEEYWQRALVQAEKAVQRSGVVPTPIAPVKKPTELFGSYFTTLTPLQAHCQSLQLYSGPALYLLEDVTGAGKTEAALILAHRLMAEQGVRGLYFALPTMATANAMFERMGQVYRHLYIEKAAPSLVLAHGARRLHRGFRDAIEDYPVAGNNDYGDGTEPAQFHCAGWLADNPKKSLLAEVGVGTVDQAVLGVLPSRHQSLRLLGLLGKVLIVDEVHAYDAYLFHLLKALLTFHASSGGSAILLSATLPQNQRQALLDAFYVGIESQTKRIERVGEEDYPLMTCANSEALQEKVLESRPEVCRTVAVERIDSLEQAEALMTQAMERGECLCWIRNTVHDARWAWRELTARHPEWEIDLFHARYALGDRLAIETRVVKRFGKEGGASVRKRQILIATPVVEQSLDIDFDYMISDLAPIDLIIQRAGRLHRHRRDQAGNPIDGEDCRGTPVLHLYAPEPLDEPEETWFSAFLPKAAYVYPNHARLWLGLRLLMAKGSFVMPDDARGLIEGVYGDDVAFPAGLETSDIASAGVQSSEGSLADYNAFRITAHYGATGVGRWWSEERAPTRLGDSTPVYLARREGGDIVPLRQEGEFPWQLSSLSMLTAKIASAQRPAAVTEALWEQTLETLPAKGRWGVLLLLDQEDKGIADNGYGDSVTVRYSGLEGLLVGDEC